jgi:hypothetical protein
MRRAGVKRSTAPTHSMRDRAASTGADDAEEDEDMQIVNDRIDHAYWSEYATPLLYTWIRTYGDLSVTFINNRDAIIGALVSQQISHPDEGDEIDQLRAVYLKDPRSTNASAANLGRYNPAARTASPARVRSSIDDNKDPEDDTPAPASSPGLRVASPVPKRTRTFAAAAATLASMPSLENLRVSLPERSAPAPLAPIAPLAPLPSTILACLTCAEPRPAGTTGPFRCTHCNLRGDLVADSVENLRMAVMVDTRLASASSSSAAAAPAGQSGGSGSNTRALSSLDKELYRLREAQWDRPFALFNDCTPSTPEQALAETRRAYLSSQYAPTSESLIELIQSGVLTHVGYCIPRLLSTIAAAAIADESVAGIMFGKNGTVTTQGRGSAPPPLADISDFFRALVCTILPALIDRPKPMLMWMTLAGTIITLNGKFGWPAANSYLEQFLAMKVSARESFSDTQPDIVMQLTLNGRSAPQQRQQQQQQGGRGNSGQQPRQQQQPGAAAGAQTQICRNFNNDACTYGKTCKYLHSCINTRNGCIDPVHSFKSGLCTIKAPATPSSSSHRPRNVVPKAKTEGGQ